MFTSFLTTVFFTLSAIFGRRMSLIFHSGSEANFWRLCIAWIMLAFWAFGFGQGYTGGILLTGLFLLWVNRDHLLNAIQSPTLRNRASHDKWRKAKWLLILNAFFGPALGVSCYQWALQSTLSGDCPAHCRTDTRSGYSLCRLDRRGKRFRQATVAGSLIAVAGAIVLAFYK